MGFEHHGPYAESHVRTRRSDDPAVHTQATNRHTLTSDYICPLEGFEDEFRPGYTHSQVVADGQVRYQQLEQQRDQEYAKTKAECAEQLAQSSQTSQLPLHKTDALNPGFSEWAQSSESGLLPEWEDTPEQLEAEIEETPAEGRVAMMAAAILAGVGNPVPHPPSNSQFLETCFGSENPPSTMSRINGFSGFATGAYNVMRPYASYAGGVTSMEDFDQLMKDAEAHDLGLQQLQQHGVLDRRWEPLRPNGEPVSHESREGQAIRDFVDEYKYESEGEDGDPSAPWRVYYDYNRNRATLSKRPAVKRTRKRTEEPANAPQTQANPEDSQVNEEKSPQRTKRARKTHTSEQPQETRRSQRVRR